MSFANSGLWIALILGILIGWLGGWLADSWFDRRRHAREAEALANRTATLPVAAAPIPAFEAELKAAEMAVQDGLAVAAVTAEAGPVDTPAVEEEPLPVIQYALRGQTQDTWAAGEPDVLAALDLPGVEREDLPAIVPFQGALATEEEQPLRPDHVRQPAA